LLFLMSFTNRDGDIQGVAAAAILLLACFLGPSGDGDGISLMLFGPY
jgi:hypothetical protein